MRLKTECNSCGAKVHLHIDYNDEQDFGEIEDGEYVEYKCPVCNEWTAMKVLPEVYVHPIVKELNPPQKLK